MIFSIISKYNHEFSFNKNVIKICHKKIYFLIPQIKKL